MSAKPRPLHARPIPTLDQIEDAEAAARQGRGRRLVLMLRSIPRDDLISGMCNARGDIIKAIAYATGRMEQRRAMAADAKAARRGRAEKRRAHTCAD